MPPLPPFGAMANGALREVSLKQSRGYPIAANAGPMRAGNTGHVPSADAQNPEHAKHSEAPDDDTPTDTQLLDFLLDRDGRSRAGLLAIYEAWREDQAMCHIKQVTGDSVAAPPAGIERSYEQSIASQQLSYETVGLEDDSQPLEDAPTPSEVLSEALPSAGLGDLHVALQSLELTTEDGDDAGALQETVLEQEEEASAPAILSEFVAEAAPEDDAAPEAEDRDDVEQPAPPPEAGAPTPESESI